MKNSIAVAVLASAIAVLLLAWGAADGTGQPPGAVKVVGGKDRAGGAIDVQLVDPAITRGQLAVDASENDELSGNAVGADEDRSNWTEFEWRELHITKNIAEFEEYGGQSPSHAELLVVSSIATILDYQGRAYSPDRQHLAPGADFKETAGFIYGNNVYRFSMHEFPEYVAWREAYQKAMRPYDPNRPPSKLTGDVAQAILNRAAEALEISKILQGQGL